MKTNLFLEIANFNFPGDGSERVKLLDRLCSFMRANDAWEHADQVNIHTVLVYRIFNPVDFIEQRTIGVDIDGQINLEE